MARPYIPTSWCGRAALAGRAARWKLLPAERLAVDHAGARPPVNSASITITTQASQVKEADSIVDIGYHYSPVDGGATLLIRTAMAPRIIWEEPMEWHGEHWRKRTGKVPWI